MTGEVIDRPTGKLALAWQLYALALERLQHKRKQSNRKQRRERPTNDSVH